MNKANNVSPYCTAIHEAGHAVMAYNLGVRFRKISVIPDEEQGSLGEISHARLPGWFQPDVEVDGRTRKLIEKRVKVCFAGTETEAAWLQRQPDTASGWEEAVEIGASHDRRNAVDLADYVTGGSRPTREAYLEWLRQEVLDVVGRGPGYDPGDPHELVIKRAREGDPRFWALVIALADAVHEAGTLSWPQARGVLRDAERDWLISRSPRAAALFETSR